MSRVIATGSNLTSQFSPLYEAASSTARLLAERVAVGVREFIKIALALISQGALIAKEWAVLGFSLAKKWVYLTSSHLQQSSLLAYQMACAFFLTYRVEILAAFVSIGSYIILKKLVKVFIGILVAD